MNTFEKLLKADAARLNEMETKVVKSRRLAFILGEKEPVDITIRALPTRDIQYVQEFLSDKKGNVIPGRYIDANFIICEKGIMEPDLHSPELLQHFGATNAKDLVEKIFQSESANIATEIMELSGADSDVRAEVKN